MEVNYHFDCESVSASELEQLLRERYADVMACFSPERLYDGENT